jgi:hypothetical protein
MKTCKSLPSRWMCLCLSLAIFLSARALSAQALNPKDIDLNDLMKETQNTESGSGNLSLIWWIPEQFWEASMAKRPNSSSPEANQILDSLRQYTVVAVIIGKETGLAEFQFLTADQLRSRVLLRDAGGRNYPVVAEPSTGAQILAAVFKPMLSKLLGNMGQHLELMFFPARNQDGQPLADALARGSFSIVVKGELPGSDVVFRYRLPLSALFAPKFCPVGGERVQADWIYCPWHGVRLNLAAPAAPSQEPKLQAPPPH